MQRMVFSLVPALLLAQLCPAAAQAPEQDIVKLGTTQGWEAYADTVKGTKICYLIGKPSKSEPAGAKRSAVFASVTHRPTEKRTNEVSFTSGYLFKAVSYTHLTLPTNREV